VRARAITTRLLQRNPRWSSFFLIAPPQRVLHAAVRLVDELKPNDHVTAALKTLHWLPVKQHIEYKVYLLMHKVCVSQAPAYMSDMVHLFLNVPDFAHLPVAITSFQEQFENSARKRFQYMALCCGMHCQTTLNQQTQPMLSNDY
jgi:hypothetical protein